MRKYGIITFLAMFIVATMNIASTATAGRLPSQAKWTGQTAGPFDGTCAADNHGALIEARVSVRRGERLKTGKLKLAVVRQLPGFEPVRFTKRVSGTKLSARMTTFTVELGPYDTTDVAHPRRTSVRLRSGTTTRAVDITLSRQCYGAVYWNGSYTWLSDVSDCSKPSYDIVLRSKKGRISAAGQFVLAYEDGTATSTYMLRTGKHSYWGGVDNGYAAWPDAAGDTSYVETVAYTPNTRPVVKVTRSCETPPSS